MTKRERELIAWEIIRCADTVSILTCEEVDDIHRRAQLGEFDSDHSLLRNNALYNSGNYD